MEVFREMYIRGDSNQLGTLMDAIGDSLPQGWHRRSGRENDIQAHMVGAKRVYCFVHDQEDDLPPSTILLAEREPGVLTASNIHPHKKRQLTHEEYNAILQEFCDRMVRPCAEKIGVRIELTASHADLSDWLSDTAAEKLRTFSTLANRRAGFLLPVDYERWLEFLVTANRERSKLDASTLRRWLVEIQGWSPEIAEQLAGEYAFGGELLTFSESRRAGV
jgi:hypothetical protein